MGEPTARRLAPVYLAELHDAEALNGALSGAFAREQHADGVRRSHKFGGRFENIYIPRHRLPELSPISDFALRAAADILGTSRLRHGFWFNEMHPGHRTMLHSHEENDELLSAVYYLASPPRSGRLILHDDPARILVTPQPGLLVLFPPGLPHEVEENRSPAVRLSLAFNFGPPVEDSAT